MLRSFINGFDLWWPWIGLVAVGAGVGLNIWWRFGARIYARERSFEMTRPFAMGGRPDLIMQERGGLLVVHDLKTRNFDRVYESDKIQLALYALLVSSSTGRRVADYAIVRVKVGGAVRLRRVDLALKMAALPELYSRFAARASSPLSARMSAAPTLCKHCGFNGRGCKGVSR